MKYNWEIICDLKEENKALSGDNKSLRDQLNKLESRERRQNLIFKNSPDDDTIDISDKTATISSSL